MNFSQRPSQLPSVSRWDIIYISGYGPLSEESLADVVKAFKRAVASHFLPQHNGLLIAG